MSLFTLYLVMLKATVTTLNGPMGIYVVSVGYFAAGIPGAAAGWLALVTPAFLAIPLMNAIGARLRHPRARSFLDGAVVASAGLIVVSAIPLARASVHTPFRASIALGAFAAVALTRVPSVAVIAAALALGAAEALLLGR
jgi:chromate transporter